MAIPAERLPGLHVHTTQSLDVCEWCEQPIPPERLSEVRGRMVARELERSNEISARMREQFAREREEDNARAQAELQAVRAEAADSADRIRAAALERETVARAEATAAAEAAAAEKLAEAQRGSRTLEAQWQSRWDQLLAERSATGEENAALKAQLAQERHAAEEATQAASEREATVRAQAQQAAEQTIHERVTAALAEHDAREAALRGRVGELETEQQSARAANVSLAAELASEKSDKAVALETAQRAGEVLAATAREQATRAAHATVLAAEQRVVQVEQQIAELRASAANEKAAAIAELTASLEKANAGRVEAETAHRDIQQTLQSLKESQATTLQLRLQEQREALAQDKDQAILETESRTFAERQKLQATVQDLTRQLEKMSAHERGEGAEINLYDALKGAFDSDRIKRVPKGIAGADIIHEIIRHGKVCGRIVYDSKNRNNYKSAYASKLRADQIAAKAEFAVLSSNHFPANVRQLHLQEGVIVACPARVVTIAQMLRRQILQLHELRLSNEAREAKTEALYKFLTSEPCRQLLETVDKLVASLLDLDVAEQKTHQALWERRGKMLTSVLKAHGELCSAFDRIIGTAD